MAGSGWHFYESLLLVKVEIGDLDSRGVSHSSIRASALRA
jgi:hypothetical protein